MWQVTPSRLKEMLTEDLTRKDSPIIFIWGQPGIGKTQIVQQVCSELSYDLVVIEVSTIHPYALSGIPIPSFRSKRVELMPLSFVAEISSSNSDNVVLFLDDFGAADPQQQRIALSITTYRRIGDYELPKSCRIIIATNREEDAAYIITPSYAILNRCKHYRMVPTIEDWITWVKRNHGDKEPLLSTIIGFNIAYPSYFCWTPETAIKKRTVAYPTPRAWTNFLIDAYQFQKDLEDLALRCACWVGDECASAFYQFCFLSEDEINKVKKDPSKIAKLDKIKQILLIRRLVDEYKNNKNVSVLKLISAITNHIENDVVGAILPSLDRDGDTEIETLRARLSLRLVEALSDN